ncbi:DNA primase [Paenibacillus elgii]|uniref:DNA primase n=1 Tax=Paenibacillus elgii TaxID=189691 RepID=UPI00203A65F9|nr:DNA primase [Paenibacillus elgii]MCM3273966.1 DNA primase [Paenibacillus elgii]
MENEFKLIKDRILNEDRFEEILVRMECEHITPKGNRYEAQLPHKFNSNNKRSVQIYLNENLSCRIRSKGFSQGDIFGLVSFIVFDCYSEEQQNKNLPKAKHWICENLGYTELITNTHNRPVEDPLKWLKEVKKKRNKKVLDNTYENVILPDEIMNQFVMYPYFPYIQEGIKYETQVEFQIGFDLFTERVVYPIHNQYGDIVSVKGRTIDPLYRQKGVYKFLYLYNFNKMIELYNWHRALYYILDKKEIIIFEGEKSCWLATQFGYRNCVAIGGDDLSIYQIQMIKNLGIDIKIILAFDKDKNPDDFKKQAKKFTNARLVYAMWDGETKLLSEDLKHSPVDLGKGVFDELYKKSFKYRIFA